MLPSLFLDPPSAIALQARAGSPFGPQDRGIAAALVLERAGRAETLYEIEPEQGPGSWRELRAEDLWPGAAESALEAVTLRRASGEEASLAELFHLFWQEKAAGGRAFADEGRKALWRGVFLRAAADPLARLLEQRNRRRPDWRITAAIRWQAGEPAAHSARQPGAILSPKSGHAPVFEWLLAGTPIAAARPLCEAAPEIPLLFEDASLIACLKPAGLPSVPGRLERLSAKGELEHRLGPLFAVHRLDQGTSGILLFARTRQAAAALSRMFRSGIPEKRYRARLEGAPARSSGWIKLPLASDPEDRPMQIVLPEDAGGKPARTRFSTVAIDAQGRAIVDLFPDGGRTHQIRVHCAHSAGLGVPIEGDPLYGSPGAAILRSCARLCLHMAEIRLPHPVAGSLLHFTSEPNFP